MIAFIAIKRPNKLNAFRSKTIEELTGALKDAGEDRKIGVVVLKGAGGKAFCVGGDIEEMRNKVVPKEEFEKEVKVWCERILELSPQALKVAKLSFNFEGDKLFPSYTHAIEILSQIYETEEFKEGMSAFLEKRKPNFSKFRK